MKPQWLSDARLIPDEVMNYIRKIGVHAVEENGESPEEVIKILGFHRSCIYDWLKRFRESGYDGLDTQKAPGSPPPCDTRNRGMAEVGYYRVRT